MILARRTGEANGAERATTAQDTGQVSVATGGEEAALSNDGPPVTVIRTVTAAGVLWLGTLCGLPPQRLKATDWPLGAIFRKQHWSARASFLIHFPPLPLDG
jgi:hypothetical protein